MVTLAPLLADWLVHAKENPMPNSDHRPPSLVRVERIALRGPGVVILTGPSSCGKGEVAAALCDMLSIERSRHLSMGEILRSTVERAKADAKFSALLEGKYSLSKDVSIFDCIDSSDELEEKVKRHRPAFEEHFGRKPSDSASGA
ncbi:MAG: hypothetical protein VCB25_08565, partial [Myxococcota bacterium]